jgi:hypothetical protein
MVRAATTTPFDFVSSDAPFVFDTALTAKKYFFATPMDRLTTAADVTLPTLTQSGWLTNVSPSVSTAT